MIKNKRLVVTVEEDFPDGSTHYVSMAVENLTEEEAYKHFNHAKFNNQVKDDEIEEGFYGT